MLLCGKDETTRPYQSAEQQQPQSRQRSDVSRAANLRVELVLRKSFHRLDSISPIGPIGPIFSCKLAASRCALLGSRRSRENLAPRVVASAPQQPCVLHTRKPASAVDIRSDPKVFSVRV